MMYFFILNFTLIGAYCRPYGAENNLTNSEGSCTNSLHHSAPNLACEE